MGRAKDLKEQRLTGFLTWLKMNGVDSDTFSMDNYMMIIMMDLYEEYRDEIKNLDGFNKVVTRLSIEDVQSILEKKKEIAKKKISMPDKKITGVK